ncbi:MAG TPA: hypothetical protein VMH27_21405 [Puia sp.]|nr:hypothetical protein [Puia sp.]
MTPEQHQILVDQFDKRLSESSPDGPDPAKTDNRQDWALLELAVEAIRLQGLTEQVRRARMQFEQEQRELDREQADNEPSELPVAPSVTVGKLADMVQTGHHSAASPAADRAIGRRISPVLQIAAILILVIVSGGILKVANTRPEGVFDKNYSDYQLSITRGADASDSLELAYRNRNWAAVYHAFEASHARTQKDYFLTAMAHMQQKEYYESIGLLKTLILSNQNKEPYFEDEAEYYLAMNYLATGQAAPAVALFDKIKADPHHVYHSRVSQMSGLDLGILRMK